MAEEGLCRFRGEECGWSSAGLRIRLEAVLDVEEYAWLLSSPQDDASLLVLLPVSLPLPSDSDVDAFTRSARCDTCAGLEASNLACLSGSVGEKDSKTLAKLLSFTRRRCRLLAPEMAATASRVEANPERGSNRSVCCMQVCLHVHPVVCDRVGDNGDATQCRIWISGVSS
jgi:hypothetical protein